MRGYTLTCKRSLLLLCIPLNLQMTLALKMCIYATNQWQRYEPLYFVFEIETINELCFLIGYL